MPETIAFRSVTGCCGLSILRRSTSNSLARDPGTRLIFGGMVSNVATPCRNARTCFHMLGAVPLRCVVASSFLSGGNAGTLQYVHPVSYAGCGHLSMKVEYGRTRRNILFWSLESQRHALLYLKYSSLLCRRPVSLRSVCQMHPTAAAASFRHSCGIRHNRTSMSSKIMLGRRCR